MATEADPLLQHLAARMAGAAASSLPLGAERLGAERLGAERLGAERLGAERLGAPPLPGLGRGPGLALGLALGSALLAVGALALRPLPPLP
jgi:hypothetical protein